MWGRLYKYQVRYVVSLGLKGGLFPTLFLLGLWSYLFCLVNPSFCCPNSICSLEAEKSGQEVSFPAETRTAGWAWELSKAKLQKARRVNHWQDNATENSLLCRSLSSILCCSEMLLQGILHWMVELFTEFIGLPNCLSPHQVKSTLNPQCRDSIKHSYSKGLSNNGLPL